MTVYLSKNAGESWRILDFNLSGGEAICFAYRSPVLLIGGNANPINFGTIIKTTDDGISWTNISDGLSFLHNTVRSLAIDPQNPDIYYAACDQGIFKSTDAGLSWSNIYDEFNTFSSLVLNPHAPNEMFTSSQNCGVLFSDDNGNSWSLFNDGLLTTRIVNLSLDRKNCFLYAGSSYQGLFQFDISKETEDITLPTGYVLRSNYPNPFKKETIIEYEFTSNSSEKVELSILNLKGQRVKTLVNRNQIAGMYFTNWNGLNDQGLQMSNGVYYYVLKVGDFIAKKKMVLTR